MYSPPSVQTTRTAGARASAWTPRPWRAGRRSSRTRGSTSSRRSAVTAGSLFYLCLVQVCLRGVRQSEFDSLCNAERGWAFERWVANDTTCSEFWVCCVQSGGRPVGGLQPQGGQQHREQGGVHQALSCGERLPLQVLWSTVLHWTALLDRSAEFHARERRCVLSRDDRRTQPEAFRLGVG